MACCQCCCEGGSPPGVCCGESCCYQPDKCCSGLACCESNERCCAPDCCTSTECCVDGSCVACDCSPPCSSLACQTCTEVSAGVYSCVNHCDPATECCIDGVCSTCPPETCPDISCDNSCCVDGYCVTCPPVDCSGDPCDEGDCCVDGACVTCTACSPGDCDPGQCCVDGYCMDCPPPECPDTSCPSGECCVDGYCQPCPAECGGCITIHRRRAFGGSGGCDRQDVYVLNVNIPAAYSFPLTVRITGGVDDDLKINGTLIEDGLYPPVTEPGSVCNGGHCVGGGPTGYTTSISSSPMTLTLVDNFGDVRLLDITVCLDPANVQNVNECPTVTDVSYSFSGWDIGTDACCVSPNCAGDPPADSCRCNPLP